MPHDSDEFKERYGQKHARVWSAWRSANWTYFNEQLAPLPTSHTLIDLGAGALHFKDLFTRFTYIGIDFMDYPHVSVVADLTKPLPLKDSEGDIVTLSNTLEHIPDPAPLMHEAHRILKPGGLIVGTVPFLLPVHQAPYDFNRYTYIQLEKLLTDAGFTDIEVVPLGAQLDVYDTIELKTFDELRVQVTSPSRKLLLKLLRTIRRIEMRFLQALFDDIAARTKVTEGYGFTARRS